MELGLRGVDLGEISAEIGMLGCTNLRLMLVISPTTYVSCPHFVSSQKLTSRWRLPPTHPTLKSRHGPTLHPHLLPDQLIARQIHYQHTILPQ